MPTAPWVVAAATRTFAPVSKTPTPTISGRSCAGRRERRRGHERGDDDDRNRGEPRGRHGPGCALVGAGVDADEEQAEAERRDEREPGSGGDATLSVRAAALGERTTMPATTSATPSHCRVAGTSPRAASTASGTTGDAAEIGATIPIAPMAKPR